MRAAVLAVALSFASLGQAQDATTLLAVSAQMLERSWRKDQILEAYLNLVPLRGELVPRRSGADTTH